MGNCALLNEKSALFTFRSLWVTGNMDAFCMEMGIMLPKMLKKWIILRYV